MKGNPHIKTALVEAGWSASRTKHSEFEDRYQRLKQRIGHKRAIVACARALTIRIYEVLDTGTPYQHSGGTLTPRSARRLVRHQTGRLHCLHRWLHQDRRGTQ